MVRAATPVAEGAAHRGLLQARATLSRDAASLPELYAVGDEALLRAKLAAMLGPAQAVAATLSDLYMASEGV